jgi:hypothetical protein
MYVCMWKLRYNNISSLEKVTGDIRPPPPTRPPPSSQHQPSTDEEVEEMSPHSHNGEDEDEDEDEDSIEIENQDTATVIEVLLSALVIYQVFCCFSITLVPYSP